jgi:hypothetical protein
MLRLAMDLTNVRMPPTQQNDDNNKQHLTLERSNTTVMEEIIWIEYKVNLQLWTCFSEQLLH